MILEDSVYLEPFEKLIFRLMDTYSLYQLNEYLRRILALNFPDALWLTAEIGQISTSRGHYYLALVQKKEEEDDILAQGEAIIWQNVYRRLRRQIGRDLESLLQDGMEIKLKCRVQFHERYGLKLLVEDLDPVYTLGKLEMHRRRTIERLQQEERLNKNKSLPLPRAIQRIAVISSETAAGYRDFAEHLIDNPYGYTFRSRLFTAAMQGALVEKEIIKRLNEIYRRKDQFDCIAVLRGGGARLDLTAFDNYRICRALSEAPLPVLSGIGHDLDQTVLDLVAHTSLKTPTAVADFLVQHNLHFEGQLQDLGRQIGLIGRGQLQRQLIGITHLGKQVAYEHRQLVKTRAGQLDLAVSKIPLLLQFKLAGAKSKLDEMEKTVALLSIENTLQRGFSLTTKDRKILTDAARTKSGDEITTLLKKGTINSRVE